MPKRDTAERMCDNCDITAPLVTNRVTVLPGAGRACLWAGGGGLVAAGLVGKRRGVWLWFKVLWTRPNSRIVSSALNFPSSILDCNISYSGRGIRPYCLACSRVFPLSPALQHLISPRSTPANFLDLLVDSTKLPFHLSSHPLQPQILNFEGASWPLGSARRLFLVTNIPSLEDTSPSRSKLISPCMSHDTNTSQDRHLCRQNSCHKSNICTHSRPHRLRFVSSSVVQISRAP